MNNSNNDAAVNKLDCIRHSLICIEPIKQSAQYLSQQPVLKGHYETKDNQELSMKEDWSATAQGAIASLN